MDRKQKNGISLMILVITIIVVAILTAVVVVTLNNTDVIGNAKEAVGDLDLKQAEQMAEYAWTSAFSKSTKEEREKQSYFEDEVMEYLRINGVDLAKYTVTVTTNGGNGGYSCTCARTRGNLGVQKRSK